MRHSTPWGLVALLLGGCQPRGERRISAEEAIFERRRQGLEALVAAARKGPLVPFDQVLVVVDQKLVRELIASVIPFERVIQNKYRIRITDAQVEFDDGFGLVHLTGRASLERREDGDTFADIGVYGSLDILELDPASGILHGRVKIMAVDAGRVDVLGLKAPARRLVEDLSREKLEDFSSLVSELEIPVRLERQITIPGVGGQAGLRLRPTTVPLKASVLHVTAFRGKLWVSIGASTQTGPPAGRSGS